MATSTDGGSSGTNPKTAEAAIPKKPGNPIGKGKKKPAPKKPDPKKKPAPKKPSAPAKAVDLMEQYASQMALINSNKELKELFKRAVAENWTPAKFQAAFINSKWYTTEGHGVTWRGAETARKTDPAQWGVALNDVKTQIQNAAKAMGFTMSQKSIDDLANTTLYTSWGKGVDEALLRKHVAELGKITGEGGEALDEITKMKKHAWDNGMTYNDDFYDNAVTDVFSKGVPINTYYDNITDAAKSRYETLATKLDAGMSVRQAAADYIGTMSQRLGIQDSDVKLDDPLMMKALRNVDPATGKPALMAGYQFEQEVKRDDRYFKTTESHQNMADLATEIARKFGKL